VSRRRQAVRRRRRVAVVTGTRAEYGILQSPMRAIADHPRLELQLVVCGMHLLKRFGHTVDQIRRDGWRIAARVPMQRGTDSPTDQAEGLARGVAGMAKLFERAGTDIVLVLGDRIEAFAGALAGFATGRMVAHVHGGDVAPGHLDEGLRHSLTKLAHIHLAASKDAARRIVRMGEDAGRVHVVGAPGLDRLFELKRVTPRASARTGPVLIVQHPCGRAAEQERRVMTGILRSVAVTGLKTVVLYPNSDRGHTGILAAIRAERSRFGPGALRVARSLPRDEYLRLLLSARVLVGNSSSGIVEAGAAGVPVVNIGQRQAGRLRAGSGVVDCAESARAVRAALERALGLRPRMLGVNPYGGGGAGRRIAAILGRVSLRPALLSKLITF